MRQDLENLARRQPALMIGGALVLGLIGARFLKSSERRGGRGFDQRSIRDRSFGYTGYNQPNVGSPEIGGGYSERGYSGSSEGGFGGGYAGA
jgi:hypothetical protein